MTALTVGSSPHTRGLFHMTREQLGSCRIIPAHAGFTTPPTRSSPKQRDHPRTRGVYAPVAPRRWYAAGSSPHTRGLPARVIATAGFRGDHPRTRGVYRGSRFPAVCQSGSSPHTRGLPMMAVISVMAIGIIPAHAGFT